MMHMCVSGLSSTLLCPAQVTSRTVIHEGRSLPLYYPRVIFTYPYKKINLTAVLRLKGRKREYQKKKGAPPHGLLLA